MSEEREIPFGYRGTNGRLVWIETGRLGFHQGDTGILSHIFRTLCSDLFIRTDLNRTASIIGGIGPGVLAGYYRWRIGVTGPHIIALH